MATRYIPAVKGGGVVPIPERAHQAPSPGIDPFLNRPNQAMPVVQPPPQNFTKNGDSNIVTILAQQLASMQTVQTVEVKQPSHQIKAPLRVWNRLNWQMPYITGRLDRYPKPGLQAPVREQSIPGYVVSQYQVTTSGVNATLAQMYQGLRAPGINEASNPCK